MGFWIIGTDHLMKAAPVRVLNAEESAAFDRYLAGMAGAEDDPPVV